MRDNNFLPYLRLGNDERVHVAFHYDMDDPVCFRLLNESLYLDPRILKPNTDKDIFCWTITVQFYGGLDFPKPSDPPVKQRLVAINL
ncbi:hypothetical protein MBLNU13_g07254t1 [Cladosporium sp. NU13]